MKKAFILSNNPKVWAAFPNVRKINGTLRHVFLEARNLIHQGNTLMTHPLSGSIKPNQTLYKSVIMAVEKGKVDYASLEYIESAIRVCDKFPIQKQNWEQTVIEDFQIIDMALLQSAVENLPADIFLIK